MTKTRTYLSVKKSWVTDVRNSRHVLYKVLTAKARQEKNIKCNITRADIIKGGKNIKPPPQKKKNFDVWNSGSSKYNIGLYGVSEFFIHS